MSINQVIAGAYDGQNIRVLNYEMLIGDIAINKETIERFEIMNENSNTTSTTKGKTKKSMVGASAKDISVWNCFGSTKEAAKEMALVKLKKAQKVHNSLLRLLL